MAESCLPFHAGGQECLGEEKRKSRGVKEEKERELAVQKGGREGRERKGIEEKGGKVREP